MFPSVVEHPTYGRLTVKSAGHFPDTAIVTDESGKEFEIEIKHLIKGTTNDTTPRK